MILKSFKNQRGQSVVEVMVATAVFALVAVVILSMAGAGFFSTRFGKDYSIAAALANEGVEAVKSIRDRNWLGLAVGDYGLDNSGGYWEFTSSSSEVIGKFTRSIKVENVQRDTNGDIVSSGGSVDGRTKKITATVSWDIRIGQNREISTVTYLTDWNVYDWHETTHTEFGMGALNGTEVFGVDEAADIVLDRNLTGESGRNWKLFGEQFVDTTDTDFGAGSFEDTEVVGSGDPASVKLTLGTRWGEYYFPFNDNDIYCMTENWAFGEGGNIYHFEGITWVEVSSPTSRTIRECQELNDHTAFAVGGFYDNDVIIMWDGYDWDKITSPFDDGIFYDIYMLSEFDGFAVGIDEDERNIARWDGSDWSNVVGPSGTYRGIDMISESFGVGVGDSANDPDDPPGSGQIIHWDGVSWSLVSSPTSDSLRGVDMISESDGWAVGENGAIIHWDGIAWSATASPTAANLNKVYMLDTDDGWAVGDGGEIIHWDGIAWSATASPTAVDLNNIFMSSPTNGFISGDTGVSLFWNGEEWSPYTSAPPDENIRAIDAVSANDIWAVSDMGEIIHYDGNIWSVSDDISNSDILAIDMISTSDGWACGENGNIYHFDGSNWSLFQDIGGTHLRAIDMISASDGWLVGNSGYIYHWDGDTWSYYDDVGGDHLQAIDMISASDGWAAGNSGYVYHWDGSSWTQFADTGTMHWYGLYMVTGNDGWLVGTSGKVYHWDGASWSQHTDTGGDEWYAIDMLSASKGYAVGWGGAIIEYNGATWTRLSSPTVRNLYGIAMADSDHGWAVGYDGMLLEYGEFYAITGKFTSQVFNSGNTETVWSYIFWDEQNTIGFGKYISIATRTGNTPIPDGTWSNWSWEKYDNDLSTISSPNGQYIQYRATFVNLNNPISSPILDEVTIIYDHPDGNHLNDLSVLDNNDIWAVGEDGRILHFNGSSWTEHSDIGSTDLNGVDMLSATDGWAAGDSGRIYHWDGTNWVQFVDLGPINWYAIDMLSATDGWIVGDSGKIYHWNGLTWSESADIGSTIWYDVAMLSATDGWAVGSVGMIYHWNGSGWSEFTDIGCCTTLYGIDMYSPSNGRIVASGGKIYVFNGSEWSEEIDTGSYKLYDIVCPTDEDCWAVGEYGDALQWENDVWRSLFTPITADINAVAMTPSLNGWAVADEGFILWLVSDQSYVSSGTFESSILDTGASSTEFVAAYWDETLLSMNVDITVATRSGDTAIPDGTWSAWSAEMTNSDGSEILSPDARYLQYRLTLTSSDGVETPIFHDITITYKK